MRTLAHTKEQRRERKVMRRKIERARERERGRRREEKRERDRVKRRSKQQGEENAGRAAASYSVLCTRSRQHDSPSAEGAMGSISPVIVFSSPAPAGSLTAAVAAQRVRAGYRARRREEEAEEGWVRPKRERGRAG